MGLWRYSVLKTLDIGERLKVDGLYVDSGKGVSRTLPSMNDWLHLWTTDSIFMNDWLSSWNSLSKLWVAFSFLGARGIDKMAEPPAGLDSGDGDGNRKSHLLPRIPILHHSDSYDTLNFISPPWLYDCIVQLVLSKSLHSDLFVTKRLHSLFHRGGVRPELGRYWDLCYWDVRGGSDFCGVFWRSCRRVDQRDMRVNHAETTRRKETFQIYRTLSNTSYS